MTGGLPLQPPSGRMPPPPSTTQLPPPTGLPPGMPAGLPRGAPLPSQGQVHSVLPGSGSQRPVGAALPRPPAGQPPSTAGLSVSIR